MLILSFLKISKYKRIQDTSKINKKYLDNETKVQRNKMRDQNDFGLLGHQVYLGTK
jgi:hypothetical protein